MLSILFLSVVIPTIVDNVVNAWPEIENQDRTSKIGKATTLLCVSDISARQMRAALRTTLLLCCGFLFRRSEGFLPSQSTNRNSAVSSLFSASNNGETSLISFDVLKNKRVLVVGGSGRVGGSVTTQLIKRGAHVTVGGTNLEKFEEAKTRWQQVFDLPMDSVDFAKLNREQSDTVRAVLEKDSYDLVVHTAGPFQGKATTPNGVVDACVSKKVPYIDVCDDYCTATAAKTKYSQKAEAAGLPCIVSTGCWVSISYRACFGSPPNGVFHSSPLTGIHLSSMTARSVKPDGEAACPESA